MMFKLPSEQDRLAIESIRRFAEHELRPLVRQWRHRLPAKEQLLELHQLIAEFGLPGGAIPMAHGGLGMHWSTQGLMFEEVAKVGGSAMAGVRASILVAHLLLAAPPALRERYLPDVIAGRKIGALALTHAPDGVHPGVHAHRDGELWRVHADGVRIVNGIHSDFLICVVRKASSSCCLAVCGRDEHGYVVRLAANDEALRSPEGELLTLRADLVEERFFAEGDSLAPLLGATRARDWIHAGIGAVAAMQEVLDIAIDEACTREEFGRPMATYSLVAARVAEMTARVDSARLMCRWVLEQLDAGRACQAEAAMARWLSADLAQQVCRQAGELHGTESHVIDGFRGSESTTALTATNQVLELQKLVVAAALTGMPAISALECDGGAM